MAHTAYLYVAGTLWSASSMNEVGGRGSSQLVSQVSLAYSPSHSQHTVPVNSSSVLVSRTLDAHSIAKHIATLAPAGL